MAKMVIGGTEYEFSFDFDLGEGRVIKRYVGISLNQIEDHDASDPDLIAAFVHIAFERTWPELSFDEIEKRVNKVKLAAIDTREDEVVQVDPPAGAPSEHGVSEIISGDNSLNGVVPTQETASRETSGRPV